MAIAICLVAVGDGIFLEGKAGEILLRALTEGLRFLRCVDAAYAYLAFMSSNVREIQYHHSICNTEATVITRAAQEHGIARSPTQAIVRTH